MTERLERKAVAVGQELVEEVQERVEKAQMLVVERDLKLEYRYSLAGAVQQQQRASWQDQC